LLKTYNTEKCFREILKTSTRSTFCHVTIFSILTFLGINDKYQVELHEKVGHILIWYGPKSYIKSTWQLVVWTLDTTFHLTSLDSFSNEICGRRNRYDLSTKLPFQALCLKNT
jgi:hypothetical protein